MTGLAARRRQWRSSKRWFPDASWCRGLDHASGLPDRLAPTMAAGAVDASCQAAPDRSGRSDRAIRTWSREVERA